MDDDPVAFLGMRCERMKTVVLVGAFQPIEDLRSGGIHGHLVEPAWAVARRHEDHLRPVLFAKPLRQTGGDGRRGEILVLQIDQLLRLLDRFQMQGLVFAHLATSAPFGLAAGDTDRHPGHRDGNVVGPGIAVDLLGNGPLPGRPEPAFPGQITERSRRCPVHHRHSLVARRAGQPRRHAATRVVIKMLWRVPTVHGHVAPTAEGDLVVDHHDLLVMTGADRPGRIEPELNHPLVEPALRLVGIEAL